MAEPANVKDLRENSEIQMAQVIAGLVQGRTVRDVAETVGVPPKRITRWMREDDRFKSLLDEVTQEVVDQIREETVKGATELVVDAAPEAAAKLHEMLNSDKDSVVVSAAAHILRLSGVGQAAKPTDGSGVFKGLVAGGASPTPASGD